MFDKKVLFDFYDADPQCLKVKADDHVKILSYTDNGWIFVKNEDGKTGMIPMSYVEDVAEEEQYQEVPSDDSWTDNDEGGDGKDSTIKRLPDNSPSETASAVSEVKEVLETSDSKSQISENPPQSVGETNDPGWSEWGRPAESSQQPQYPTYPSPPSAQGSQNSEENTVHRARPASTVSDQSEIAPGRVKSVVGRDFSRFKRYSKVGAEDFIIGNVSKKCDRILYRIQDQGNGVRWENGMNSDLTCAVRNPEAKRKFAGMKKYVAYNVTSSRQSGVVDRRYKHFDWLAMRIEEQFPCSLTPKLPAKQSSGRFEEDFIQRRQELLDLWLREVCRHPILSSSPLVEKFLTIRTDADKQWKEYKRDQEKSPYQVSGFWQAVAAPLDSRFVEDGKTQMKKFDEFTKGFDKANHSLSDSLAKSIKVHQAPMKNEMDQLGNSLGQLAVVFKTKVQKRNSGELAEATENAAKTMKQAAEHCSSWARETTVPFLDTLWLYSGLLSNVDEMIETGKQSTDKVETNMSKLGPGTPESRELKKKGETINAVLLSEADYLDQIRIPDFSKSIKSYLAQRAEFHRKQMEFFEQAASQFPDFE